LAVAQHLEVQVGPGRAPGVAEPRDDLAALHGVADGDEIRRVVRVAGHVAVAVIDLDELAVTLTRPGPDHDARADRQLLAALAAGKVDPLVERAAAGERIGPLAEARRDVPRRDRTAAGSNLVRELAVQQKILEDVELAGPVLELEREAVQRAQDSAQIELVGIGEKLLRAAERRRRAEVELAVIEPRHLREPRAERVEPDAVRVHLAEPERERVDAPLQAPAGLLEQRLLRLELGAPGLDLRARIRDPVRIGRAPPYV